MSTQFKHPPTFLLKQLLESAFAASALPSWPLLIGYLPDNDASPSDCIVLYDTEAAMDGRIQRTGEHIQHPGIQLLCRSSSYLAGWEILQTIATYLSSLKNVEILVQELPPPEPPFRVVLASVALFSGVLALGLESGTKNRYLFTLNLLTTITK